jgi:hypothetical protein
VARSLLERTMEALFGDARPREDMEEGDALRPGESALRAVVSRADERAALAAAALLLSKVSEKGGTRVDADALGRATERLLAQFTEMEQARIKREVARTLLWLWEAMGSDETTASGARAAGDEAGAEEADDEDEQTLLIPDRIYPVGDKLDLLRAAIAESRDAEIDYFTFYRGKLAWRRISPLEMEGDDYVLAYCHWRQERRRFRVSRIRALRVIDRLVPAGAPVAPRPIDEPGDPGPGGGEDVS